MYEKIHTIIYTSYAQSVCARFAAFAFIYRFFDKFDVHFALENSIGATFSHIGFMKKIFLDLQKILYLTNCFCLASLSSIVKPSV